MKEDITLLKDVMSKLATNGDVVMGKLDNILQARQKMNSKLDTVLNILRKGGRENTSIPSEKDTASASKDKPTVSAAQTSSASDKIKQAKNLAVAQAQQEGSKGNFRIFDSPFGNFLVPVIPTRAELGGQCRTLDVHFNIPYSGILEQCYLVLSFEETGQLNDNDK
nr:uncharacterized protein LOC109186307 isoform X2 [Ipomoea batatas]